MNISRSVALTIINIFCIFSQRKLSTDFSLSFCDCDTLYCSRILSSSSSTSLLLLPHRGRKWCFQVCLFVCLSLCLFVSVSARQTTQKFWTDFDETFWRGNLKGGPRTKRLDFVGHPNHNPDHDLDHNLHQKSDGFQWHPDHNLNPVLDHDQFYC